jgi:hypothetical protein
METKGEKCERKITSLLSLVRCENRNAIKTIGPFSSHNASLAKMSLAGKPCTLQKKHENT